jgi:hypothetical protein
MAKDGFLFLDALYRCVRSEIASSAVIADAIDDEAVLSMHITAFCHCPVRQLVVADVVSEAGSPSSLMECAN